MLSRGTIKAHKQELKRRLRDIGGQENFHGELYQDCLRLLDKEMPRTAVLSGKTDNIYILSCPVCGVALTLGAWDANGKFTAKNDRYCPHCGQRLT